ncbi:MAG: hypothetical protein M3R25_14945, partial [Bacteroidota bacterium]|nr:hypothetical protein [Bacteroidota bacterium]
KVGLAIGVSNKRAKGKKSGREQLMSIKVENWLLRSIAFFVLLDTESASEHHSIVGPKSRHT